MTSRSTRTSLLLRQPFRVKCLDAPQPAGRYTLETEEALLDGLSFPAWRQVGATLTREGVAAGGLVQALPLELAEAARLTALAEPSPEGGA